MKRLIPGTVVFWRDQSWLLLDIPEVGRALIKQINTSRVELVEANELKLTSNKNKPALVSLSKESWHQAQEKFNALRPLLQKSKRERTYEQIDAIAKQFGKSRVTIYRWLNKIQRNQSVSALIREKRNDNGKIRINDEINNIITDKINNFYLAKERPTVIELWEQIAIACRNQNIKPPSRNTVHRRVDKVQDRLVMAKRFSHKKARETYQPIYGSFPNADTPFAVYQIDHTPVDIILVDEIYRQPIGRPFLTIVTDTCSRMLAGFYLSLDPPGALATGLALAHAILPKQAWLVKHEIDTEWPIYGIPIKIFADNAAEFRGTMLIRACHEYGIIMENRPKGLPNYGGHVERLFRTFMKRVQSVEGSTFSNTEERGEYESEKKSILTLNEFDHWFGVFVTKVYHQRKHKGIGNVPPIKLFERFILGDDDTVSIGLPGPIEDERKLKLDFTPFVERTIQEYGVLIDGIHYYADILKTWIHARNPENPKLKRKFIFARDPRDISLVYFLDPDTRLYHDIPYGNTFRPPMSLWELTAITKKISERPECQANEDLIFEGLREMRQIQENASQRTKSVRRSLQRRKNWSSVKNTQAEAEKETVLPKDTDWATQLVPFEVEEAE